MLTSRRGPRTEEERSRLRPRREEKAQAEALEERGKKSRLGPLEEALTGAQTETTEKSRRETEA